MPPPALTLVPPRSVGFLIVVTMPFFGPPWLWIELLELLCFIVLLKSVDIIPTDMVELIVLPTPVTCMVPDGFSAANIPFYLVIMPVPLFGLREFLTPTFFLF